MLTACASVVVDVPGLNEQQEIWLAGIVSPNRTLARLESDSPPYITTRLGR